eukprot:XP_011660405.1 PREDICTED: uncharacterized protein LOC105436507 isoform X1 [Strongylocentrotus purpuratus]
MIQRRYARFVCNDHHRTSSVKAMRDQLQWPYLQERRAQVKVAMMFCIKNSLIFIPLAALTPSLPASGEEAMTRNSKCHMLGHKYCKGVSFLMPPGSVTHYPQAAVTCTSLPSFKREVLEIQLS